MIFLYLFSILIAFIYIFIITHFLTGWNEIEEWETSDDFKTQVKISIIIPYRNEEENIEKCIKSVLQNQYPKKLYEIICINDSSDDKSEEIVSGIKAKNIISGNLEEHSGEKNLTGKKAAIEKGIQMSTGDLIITLDADCVTSDYWLKNIASYYTYTKKRMIVGMVKLEGHKNTLEYFQIMDTCGTMGLHAAGIHNKTHFLANGANFIFEKSLFLQTNPFENNSQYASGDDVFFINNVASANPEYIGFLKCKPTIVQTAALRTWNDLWQQRKRWATKHSGYSDGIYKWMTAIIWLLSFTIIINIIMTPFTSGFSFFIALSVLLIKGIMDFLYLQNMCSYFDQKNILKKFIICFLVQTVYIFLAGLVAMKGGTYVWKGRNMQ